MSANANSEASSTEVEKPAQIKDEVKFPAFPEPQDDDFDDDISEEEKNYYKEKFPDLNTINSLRLHCSACDRHLGSAAQKDSRMRCHPMLRTLMCHTCHSFYNSGEFDKGDDGSELYCRWCGQGGQVYCCSDCPVVFCARCIKRNLGTPKIKEIENTDDWKCFKCNSKCLWDLRATCWALLRYCKIKNNIAAATEDLELKQKYRNSCSTDYSECCRNKNRKKSFPVSKKEEAKKTNSSVLTKIPPTIQVKKFASINADDGKDKKPTKRSNSPKTKLLKTPLQISTPKLMPAPPILAKKMRMGAPVLNPVRFQNERKLTPNIPNFSRIRVKPPQLPLAILNNQFNGYSGPLYTSSGIFNNLVGADNINLSLESLTQGLDVNAIGTVNNDVVCTPDFPLEPLCEVTEEPNDDDVQCITPGPVAAPKLSNPPPLVPRVSTAMADLSPDNIIQMTENDVTVNALTGGLKFRVDPQTLSSNKMYRLPDGRIFAINANPNMPGGYSATIVAVSDNTSTPKGNTYAAKLSAVTSVNHTPPSIIAKPKRNYATSSVPKRPVARASRTNKEIEEKESGGTGTNRDCDLKIPVEWYRYNLIDAIDSLEYSLVKLKKLKREATTMYLRTRTLPEMRYLHKSLDRLLNTSATRFNEVRDTLSKEMKQYVQKKLAGVSNNISDDDDDDDDVEILNVPEDDDPIFIDEGSMDSNINETNGNDTQEVDLTGAASSEHNDSAEKSNDAIAVNDITDGEINNKDTETKDNEPENKSNNDEVNDNSANKMDIGEEEPKSVNEKDLLCDEKVSDINAEKNVEESVTIRDENDSGDHSESKSNEEVKENNKTVDTEDAPDSKTDATVEEKEQDTDLTDEKDQDIEMIDEEKLQDTEIIAEEKLQDPDVNDKNQDAEMTEELIETLLKDDDNSNGADVSQEFQEP